MQRSALQLLAVTCLVALAGCSGALSGGGGAGEQTPDDVTYPAGVSENGTNVTALADAHESHLEDRNFTLAVDSTVEAPSGNRTVAMDAAVGAARDNVLVNGTSSGQRVAVYLTPDRRFTRIAAGGDGEATYRATNRSPDAAKLVPSSYSGARYIDQLGGMANFTPDGVRTVDGTPLVVLRADGSNATATEQNVTAYDATLLVDERGVVHSMTVNATSERNGQQFRTQFSLAVSNVSGTTVEAPTWLDEARNRTSG